MFVLTSKVFIALTIVFSISQAYILSGPKSTSCNDYEVPHLDLDNLDIGYHGLIKENETLVDVKPQIRAVGAEITSFRIANKHHGDAPFEIIVKDKGYAKLRALYNLNCEKRRNYKFDIAAVACNGAQSENATVHITVIDVNEYAPQFLQPAYVSTVDEGRLYEEVVRVEASDRDCTPKFGDVCKYEILTTDQPFVIDNEGAIRNTEPLDYERSHNYILSVVAYDCGMKQSAPAMVTVKVNRVCSPGWRGIPERVDYATGAGSQPLLPSARLELCDAPCILKKEFAVKGKSVELLKTALISCQHLDQLHPGLLRCLVMKDEKLTRYLSSMDPLRLLSYHQKFLITICHRSSPLEFGSNIVPGLDRIHMSRNTSSVLLMITK